MKEIKSLNLRQCWKMVSRISNLDQAAIAVQWLGKASISVEAYGELMDSVAYITRELYRTPGHCFN